MFNQQESKKKKNGEGPAFSTTNFGQNFIDGQTFVLKKCILLGVDTNFLQKKQATMGQYSTTKKQTTFGSLYEKIKKATNFGEKKNTKFHRWSDIFMTNVLSPGCECKLFAKKTTYHAAIFNKKNIRLLRTSMNKTNLSNSP